MQIGNEEWRLWCEQYINPQLFNKEYELIIDDWGNNIDEFPLFTPKFCSDIIELTKGGLWTTDRHNHYPTTDMLIGELGMKEIYNRVINDFVYPLAIWYWKLEGDEWVHNYHKDETFIAKYLPDKQAHLSVHHDRDPLTCVVKLNDDFTGGGTYFPKYKTLVQPKQIGHAIIHPGQLTHRHGARPVLTGERYIIVSFID